MLKIDSDIKALFARRDVRRNFRVMFPDGERADLINEDIILDTVRLTESVCSETVFRFGCCERSVMEFETVGVENIRGCRIRCALEIETSSLSASAISSIEIGIRYSGYDGEVVREEASDLGYGFFRIPYGLFFVESCPRDHTDRRRRKVTAMTPDPTVLSPVEQVRLSTYRPCAVPSYEPAACFMAEPLYLASANLLYQSPESLNSNDWGVSRYVTDYTWSAIQGFGTAQSVTLSRTVNNHTYAVTISGTYASPDFSDKYTIGQTDAPVAQLRYLDMSGWDTDEAWNWVKGQFEASGVAVPDVAAHTRVPRAWLQPHIGYDINDQYGPYDHAPLYFLPDEGCPIFMGEINYPSRKANGFFRLMWNLTCTYKVDGTTRATRTFFPLADLSAQTGRFTIYGSDPGQDRIPYYKTNSYTANNTEYYTFLDSYQVLETLQASLEMAPKCVKQTRAGKILRIQLNNANPTALSADSEESVWWDDAQISPIGRVLYRTHNSVSPDLLDLCYDYASGGGSIYDLRGNVILQRTHYYLPSNPGVINNSSNFKAGLSKAEFVPLEAVIHDQPWMEAGDAITLATTDPDAPSLRSFILSQTISGVYSLRQEISASGGSPLSTGYQTEATAAAVMYGDIYNVK